MVQIILFIVLSIFIYSLGYGTMIRICKIFDVGLNFKGDPDYGSIYLTMFWPIGIPILTAILYFVQLK